jgi:hypothetical protein
MLLLLPETAAASHCRTVLAMMMWGVAAGMNSQLGRCCA